MLTLLDASARLHRRELLSIGSLALGGLSLSSLFAARAAGTNAGRTVTRQAASTGDNDRTDRNEPGIPQKKISKDNTVGVTGLRRAPQRPGPIGFPLSHSTPSADEVAQPARFVAGAVASSRAGERRRARFFLAAPRRAW
jgi:hypothetical protein